MSHLSRPSAHALVAECIGTCMLTCLVLLSLGKTLPLPTPVIAALVVGICVYTVGGISGAHVNPAVTVGLLSIRKITPVQAVGYIVAQLIGAAVAMFIAGWLLGSLPAAAPTDAITVLVGEALGAFLLVFGVSAVVHGSVPPEASGIAIGGSLLLGILLASSVGNGVVNPAVAVGIGSLSISYVLGPLIGGVLAAQAYQWLMQKPAHTEPHA